MEKLATTEVRVQGADILDAWKKALMGCKNARWDKNCALNRCQFCPDNPWQQRPTADASKK